MAVKVREVQAIFGGQHVRFRLHNRVRGDLETQLGVSAAAMRQVILAEAYDADDVLKVLAAASLPPIGLDDGGASVRAVLQRRPPETYAPLAVKVLTAFLTGLEIADSTFDEDAR